MSMSGTLSNGGVPKNPTFGTVIATSALTLGAGATFNLYNTADQTTNYERLRADWSGNVARIYTQFGGSASTRAIFFGVGSTAGTAPNESLLTLQRGAAPFVSFNSNVTSSVATAAFASAGGTVTASSGTQTAFAIAPTINQSGTAGYTAFDINPTETATGSGTKLLQRWAVGGTAQAYMTNTGGLVAGILVSTNGLSMGNSLGAVDLTITRDAADTLALRRSTNAQTFRVYNTYTDASNYERGIVGWGSSVFYVGPTAAGTGTLRSMVLIGNTIGIQTGPSLTNRWSFNAAGHFVADTDNTYDIGASGANRPRALYLAGGITHGSATLLTTTTALTNGAAAATGTLTNAPTAGNPTKWIPINDNGTTRYIPAW